MCDFRLKAIEADAASEAGDREARLARAHLSACVPCRRTYGRLRREMRGRDWQRAASAAFLPAPSASRGHGLGLGKIAIWIEQRLPFLPRGGGARATEALGGAGLVKAAATGTALVAAGSALTGHLVHDLAGSPHRSHERGARSAQRHVGLARAGGPSAELNRVLLRPTRQPVAPARLAARSSSSTPPSRGLGYLALGGSSTQRPASTASESSSPVRATAASVGEPTSTASHEGEPQPTQSGGGTSLSYLGR
jgi:hypothetical protein